MKVSKKILLLLLMICLALACVFPAFATASVSNMNMTVSSTGVTVGDTVTVTLTVNGNPELSWFTGGIRFDTSAFTCTGIQGSGTSSAYVDAYDDELGSWSAKKADSQSTLSEANSNGTVGFSFHLGDVKSVMIRMRGSVLITATFEAKTCGSASFVLYEDSSTINPLDGPYAFYSMSAKTVGVSIKHDLAMTQGSTPGCEHTGRKDFWTCSRCGRLYSDAEGNNEVSLEETYIAALGHKWGDPVVTKEATCTEAGKKTYTCTQCYVEKYDEEIPALGHSWNEGSVTKDPTCTEMGKRTYTCIRCSTAKTEDIAALGHVWDEGKVTKAPTCTEAGKKTYTCTRCSTTRTEDDAAALGHDYKTEYEWNRELTRVTANAVCRRDASHKVSETVNVEKREPLAACGQPGTITYTARFANQVFETQTKKETVAAVPHQLKRIDAVQPTCTQPGVSEYYSCTVCGKTFNDADGKEEMTGEAAAIEPLGHEMSAEPVWEWSEDGKTAKATFSCVRCGETETVDAEMKTSYNLLVASAKGTGSDKVYTDRRHVDSKDHKLNSLEAVGKDGQKIVIEEKEVASADLLTPEIVYSVVDTKQVKSSKLDQFTVLWQREIKVPEGSGAVTLKFKTEGIGENEELLVFHKDAKRGWHMVGYARDAQEVEVTLDDFSPVALVKRTGAPAKEAEPIVEPAKNTDRKASAEKGLLSSLLSDKKLWIAAGAVLLVIIVVIIIASAGKKKGKDKGKKKGRHYK